MAEEQLRLWRAQLAEEESDDDDLGSAPPVVGRLPPPRRTAGPLGSMGSIHAAAAPGNDVGSDKMTYLQHKLQVLELQLEERDLELQEVRMQAANERAAADRSAPSGSSRDGIASDVRDAKLKELASKSKQSTMALGREKAHSAQLAAELASLRQQLKTRDDKAPCGGNGGGSLAACPPSPSRELKEVQQRLAEANKRLSEQQVGHDAVKSELAKYRRALEREVGSADGVAKLLDGSSGARGRAEQISLLKDQLKEAQRRVAAVDGSAVDGPGSPASRHVERTRDRLANMEQERRHELERLLVAEQQLTNELGEARRRADAQAARIKNLEIDVRNKREKLKLLLDKSDNDNHLVSVLRQELDKYRKGEGGGRPADGSAEGEAQRRVANLTGRVSQQQVQIDRQEKIILSLREQLAQDGGGADSGKEERLESENSQLRELVVLLQDKLASG